MELFYLGFITVVIVSYHLGYEAINKLKEKK